MPLVPQQDEGNLQLGVELLGERQRHGDQIAVMPTGITTAVGRGHRNQFVARLGGNMQRLLEA